LVCSFRFFLSSLSRIEAEGAAYSCRRQGACARAPVRARHSASRRGGCQHSGTHPAAAAVEHVLAWAAPVSSARGRLRRSQASAAAGPGGSSASRPASAGWQAGSGSQPSSATRSAAVFSFLYFKKTKFKKYMPNRKIFKNGCLPPP